MVPDASARKLADASTATDKTATSLGLRPAQRLHAVTAVGARSGMPDRAAVIEMSGVLWSDWGKPQRIANTLRRIGRQPAFPLECLRRPPAGLDRSRRIAPSLLDDDDRLVRLALGGAMVASAVVDKLLSYERGLATVARYDLTAVVPVSPELWVVGSALVEGSLGLAILLGVATRLSAIVTFAVLTLTVFALPDDPVIAHVGLFGTASILVVLGAGRWSLDGWLARRRAS